MIRIRAISSSSGPGPSPFKTTVPTPEALERRKTQEAPIPESNPEENIEVLPFECELPDEADEDAIRAQVDADVEHAFAQFI